MRPGVLALYLPLFTNVVERLSEKGTSNAPIVDLAGLRRAKWTEKLLCGDLQGYAASASEAFRTVSEVVFSEVRLSLVQMASWLQVGKEYPRGGSPKGREPCPKSAHNNPTPIQKKKKHFPGEGKITAGRRQTAGGLAPTNKSQTCCSTSPTSRSRRSRWRSTASEPTSRCSLSLPTS